MNKTTSTDIEEFKKEFGEKFGRLLSNVLPDKFVFVENEVWDFFAPHLSNKSELKKEAVGDFVKLLKEYEFYSGDIGVTANRMGGGMSDLEFLAKQYLSSGEKEESEKQ